MVVKKHDKVKFDITIKTNEKDDSKKYGGIRFIRSYRFLSSSLDKLIKTLVDNSHKILKGLKEQSIDNNETKIIVNEENIMIKNDRYDNDSI